MKRTGFIIAGCFLLFQCQIIKAQQKNDWERQHLKWRVKEVKEVRYEAKDTIGLIKKEEIWKNYIIKFDTSGNQIEKLYNSSSVFSFKTVFIYDKNGNVIERTHFNPDSTITSRSIMKYDSNGKLIKRTHMASDSSLSEVDTWKYDKNGNEIEYVSDDLVYNRNDKIIYTYDNFGKLKKMKWYKLDTFFCKYKYNLDSNRKIKKQKRYNLHGWLTNIDTYKYDSSGNLIEEINYNAFGAVQKKLTYKYDINKNITEECEYWSSRILKKKSTFDYDSNGNLIEEIGYDSSGEIFYKFNY